MAKLKKKGSWRNAGLAATARKSKEKIRKKVATKITLPDLQKVWDDKRTYEDNVSKVDFNNIVENLPEKAYENRAHIPSYKFRIVKLLHKKHGVKFNKWELDAKINKLCWSKSQCEFLWNQAQKMEAQKKESE